MYSGLMLLLPGCALVLGSAWGFVPITMLMAPFIVRTVLEDGALRRELPGYEEYCSGRVVTSDELLYDAIGQIRRGRAATRVGLARAAFLQDGVGGPFQRRTPQSAAALLLFTDSRSSLKRRSRRLGQGLTPSSPLPPTRLPARGAQIRASYEWRVMRPELPRPDLGDLNLSEMEPNIRMRVNRPELEDR